MCDARSFSCTDGTCVTNKCGKVIIEEKNPINKTKNLCKDHHTMATTYRAKKFQKEDDAFFFAGENDEMLNPENANYVDIQTYAKNYFDNLLQGLALLKTELENFIITLNEDNVLLKDEKMKLKTVIAQKENDLSSLKTKEEQLTSVSETNSRNDVEIKKLQKEEQGLKEELDAFKSQKTKNGEMLKQNENRLVVCHNSIEAIRLNQVVQTAAAQEKLDEIEKWVDDDIKPHKPEPKVLAASKSSTLPVSKRLSVLGGTTKI